MKTIPDTLLRDFKLWLYEAERSENTISKYIRDVRRFSEWLGCDELHKPAVLRYKKELSRCFAPASVNSVLSSLNTFFTFIGRGELRIKTLKIQHHIFSDPAKELTKNEYQRLLRAAQNNRNERLFLLMQTICSTGIRVSELRYITVEAFKLKFASINCKGKLRVIILPDALCLRLKKYAREQKIKSGSVFISKNGNPLDRTNIWSEMKKLCKSADVPEGKVFPHNLRHLFARTYYASEKDIVRLADILGHASINTTRIYTTEDGTIHRKQIQKLGLLRL